MNFFTSQKARKQLFPVIGQFDWRQVVLSWGNWSHKANFGFKHISLRFQLRQHNMEIGSTKADYKFSSISVTSTLSAMKHFSNCGQCAHLHDRSAALRYPSLHFSGRFLLPQSRNLWTILEASCPIVFNTGGLFSSSGFADLRVAQVTLSWVNICFQYFGVTGCVTHRFVMGPQITNISPEKGPKSEAWRIRRSHLRLLCCFPTKRPPAFPLLFFPRPCLQQLTSNSPSQTEKLRLREVNCFDQGHTGS